MYLLPVNIKHAVNMAARGESGLAGNLMSFIAAMNSDQRDAVARLIGATLTDIAVDGGQRVGELWLRDAEITAWHVLVAHRDNSPKNREEFFEAWRNA